ncbi:MAG: DUF3575 domain-containing protein [Rikenellaceae bacterium]
MRKIFRHIFLVVLILSLAPRVVLAQKAGVRPMSDSAMDYLFQGVEPWSGKAYSGDEHQHKYDYYINFGTGLMQGWQNSLALDNSSWWKNENVSVGYRIAPVHAVEAGITWNWLNNVNYFGANLNYVFNLTSYASRSETPKRWELMFLSGLTADYNKDLSFGVQLGTRLQYNISPSVGIFVEPKVSSVVYSFNDSPLSAGDVNTSVLVGLSVAPSRVKDVISSAIKKRKDWWESVGYDRVPVMEVKTNLLFDAATLVNVEIEVPIKNRISIAGEWVFPWWCNDNGNYNSARNRTQLLNASLDVKYWFGNRENKRALTGWYAGVFSSGGLYDFERAAKGYQGEFYLALGACGGYAHTLNKRGNLRMEYSLGFGYLQSDYAYYEAFYDSNELRWRAVKLETGRYSVFAPLKAKVSIGWMISRKKRHK